MAESGFQERTEKATPKKRRDAREKGRVARSMEVNSFSVLLAGALAITFLGSYSGTGIEQLFDHIFRNLFSPGMDPESIETLYISVLMKFVLVFAPFALFLTVAALASNFLQVGFIFSADPVTPKLEKISPIKGFGRIFSKETLMELFKSFVKIGAIGLVAYITVKNELGGVFQLADSDLSSLVESIRRVTLLLLFRSILVIAIIAVLDFAFQKYSFEEKLKMTKQEVKEEYKETEGDPMIKSRARSIARSLAMSRVMNDVPKAGVVVTNPTHLAVALMYDETEMAAPIVVAKGAELLAARIKELARDNDVPIVENKPLARLLYRQVEIGGVIPSQLFEAVAEVLAYVYMLKKRKVING